MQLVPCEPALLADAVRYTAPRWSVAVFNTTWNPLDRSKASGEVASPGPAAYAGNATSPLPVVPAHATSAAAATPAPRRVRARITIPPESRRSRERARAAPPR